jgi:hypothetical protein
MIGKRFQKRSIEDRKAFFLELVRVLKTVDKVKYPYFYDALHWGNDTKVDAISILIDKCNGDADRSKESWEEVFRDCNGY